MNAENIRGRAQPWPAWLSRSAGSANHSSVLGRVDQWEASIHLQPGHQEQRLVAAGVNLPGPGLGRLAHQDLVAQDRVVVVVQRDGPRQQHRPDSKYFYPKFSNIFPLTCWRCWRSWAGAGAARARPARSAGPGCPPIRGECWALDQSQLTWSPGGCWGSRSRCRCPPPTRGWTPARTSACPGCAGPRRPTEPQHVNW